MKRAPPILVLLLLTCAEALHGEWQWQHPVPQGNTIRKTAFANPRMAYAVGDAGTILVTYDGGAHWLLQYEAITDNLNDLAVFDSSRVFAVGDNGMILRTTDGGYHWLEVPGGTSQGLNAIFFYDRMLGWAAGDGRTILRTTDGGTTWVPSSLPAGQGGGSINTVAFLSAAEGWAGGSTGQGSSGALYRTTDGGVNWIFHSMPSAPVLRIRFAPGDSAGFLLGAGGLLLRTGDDTTWLPVSSGTTFGLNDIVWATSSEAFIGADQALLLHSIDGGLTWAKAPFGGSFANINGLASSMDNVIAAGEYGFLARRSAAGWTVLNNGDHLALNWITFSDRLNGFAVGQYGFMMKTTDGGATWAEIHNGITGDSFYGAHMVGSYTYLWAVGDLGVILFSSDGGTSWTQQTSNVGGTLFSVWFVDQDHGWIVGDAGIILETTDAGQNWELRTSQVGNTLYGITMADPLHGWITGGSGLILSTFDGSSWAAQSSTTSAVLYAPAFHSATEGFCAGENGLILRTTDGGATWEMRPSGTVQDIYLTAGRSPAMIHAVGDSGLVLNSRNNGDSWSFDFPGTAYSMFGLAVESDSLAWICGDNGSILVRRASPVAGVVLPTPAGIPGGFRLEQNCPNPFNPTTTIEYTLAGAGEVRLAVYDLLGREVAVLLEGRKPAGTYRIQFTPEGFSSGVYLYRLSTSGASTTRKMILLK